MPQSKKTKQQEQRLRENVQQAKSDKAELKAMPGKKAPPQKGGASSILARIFGRPDIPQTVQQSIPYKAMYRDGICQVNDRLFTKTITFSDITYQLAQNEDKTQIFESYCDFLNCATRSRTNTIPQGIKLCGRLDHVVLKTGGFRLLTEAITDTLKSGMMG